MANLKYELVQAMEDLFELSSGYILDFSNNSFQRFVKGIINVDIYQSPGYEEYCSKANKLRQIFANESNEKVAKLINALLNYYEDYKLKSENLTEFDKKKILEIKKQIECLENEEDENIEIIKDLDILIQKISTRNAKFNEMALDEKLKEIGNLIEYLLKKDGKFIKIDCSGISVGFIDENNIKELRKKIQCFRHSSRESIQERNVYTEEQKQFMVEYGIVVCNMIYNNLK